jgi:hypothetical protein
MDSPSEREKLGIGATGTGFPVEPMVSLDVVEIAWPAPNKMREEMWVKEVQSHDFETALAICGLAHALSFTFRLIEAGINVEETRCYIPYSKLGKKS